MSSPIGIAITRSDFFSRSDVLEILEAVGFQKVDLSELLADDITKSQALLKLESAAKLLVAAAITYDPIKAAQDLFNNRVFKDLLTVLQGYVSMNGSPYENGSSCITGEKAHKLAIESIFDAAYALIKGQEDILGREIKYVDRNIDHISTEVRAGKVRAEIGVSAWHRS